MDAKMFVHANDPAMQNIAGNCEPTIPVDELVCEFVGVCEYTNLVFISRIPS